MTLVLAAPATGDHRPGGFTFTAPGELLVRATVCDAGRADGCDCGRSWAGTASHKGTTLAEVVDRDITPAAYIDTITAHLIDVRAWPPASAVEEAWFLLDVAADHPPGTLLTLDIHDGQHVIAPMEA